MKRFLLLCVLCLTFGIQSISAKSVGTIKELTEQCEKQTKQYTDSCGKKHQVYKGPRGGYYYLTQITRGKHKGMWRKQYITKEYKG